MPQRTKYVELLKSISMVVWSCLLPPTYTVWYHATILIYQLGSYMKITKNKHMAKLITLWLALARVHAGWTTGPCCLCTHCIWFGFWVAIRFCRSELFWSDRRIPTIDFYLKNKGPRKPSYTSNESSDHALHLIEVNFESGSRYFTLIVSRVV